VATTNTGTAEPVTERFPPVLKFIFARHPQILQLVINSELSVSKTRLAPRRLSHIHPSVSQVWLSTQQQTVVDTTQTTGDQSDSF